MPYDMRVRTSAGWMNMTDMIAFRKLHSQEWEFNSTSNNSSISRQVNVSLRDHTDFNGKDFEIFIKGNIKYVGTTPSSSSYLLFSNFGLIWSGGNRISSTSTFRLTFSNPAMPIGSYVVNVDAYIMET